MNARSITDFIAKYGLAIVFGLVIVIFALLRPSTFLSSSNIDNILISESVTALLALAEMVPLSTRQFDLSVGYHLGMAQVFIIGFQVENHLPWLVAALIVLLIGLLVGIINGILVTRFKIDSFIATMGVGTLLYGVSNWYTGGQQIVAMSLPASFTNLVSVVWGVPLPALYVLVVAVLLWLMLERMPAGRALYVIGSSVKAAELTGIAIKKYVTSAFALSGLLCGIAGIVLGSILQTGTPSVGPDYLLPAFAGALLGATSIKPGRVNVWGTILAVLVLAFSFSGVQQMGASFYVEYFFDGGILIVAVGLSVYAESRRRRAIAMAEQNSE